MNTMVYKSGDKILSYEYDSGVARIFYGGVLFTSKRDVLILYRIHVNPERSCGGTNGEPPSEASQLRKGGPGVLPRKI